MPQQIFDLSSDESDQGNREIAYGQEYQKIRDAPSPVPVESSLHDAINRAPDTELRALLVDIIEANAEARAKATSRLLLPTSGTGKRKRFETCKNCDEDYQVDKNEMQCCVYHQGEKEVDDEGEFWADHDDNHGSPLDYKDDPDMANGFIWRCCEQSGDAEGCVVSRHEPKHEDLVKRVR